MHLAKVLDESLPDTHWSPSYVMCGVHIGHRFAGERAKHHADQEQSTPVHSARTAHDALLASGVVDVGRHCERSGANLKNPSTSVDAESSPLHDTCGRLAWIATVRPGSVPPKTLPRHPPGPRTRTTLPGNMTTVYRVARGV